MNFIDPNVMSGNTVGDWNYNDAYLFSVPEDKNGSFVSPAFNCHRVKSACVSKQTLIGGDLSLH